MGKTDRGKSKKKHKDRKDKKKSKKLKKHKKDKKDSSTTPSATTEDTAGPDAGKSDDADFAIPLDLMNSKSHAPETPEEYQKRQSRIRREVDPSTGRIRLIKGDGEVLEEIVSKERHKTINTEATQSDGAFFQENTLGKYK